MRRREPNAALPWLAFDPSLAGDRHG
jgi:hypothetical protein